MLKNVKKPKGFNYFPKINKMSVTMRRLWADPEWRALQISKYTGKPKNFTRTELRKRRKRCLERNADPEFHKNKNSSHNSLKKNRKNRSIKMKEAHANGAFDHRLKASRKIVHKDRINVNSGVVFENQLEDL